MGRNQDKMRRLEFASMGQGQILGLQADNGTAEKYSNAAAQHRPHMTVESLLVCVNDLNRLQCNSFTPRRSHCSSAGGLEAPARRPGTAGLWLGQRRSAGVNSGY
jgi:hypothetical protein